MWKNSGRHRHPGPDSPACTRLVAVFLGVTYRSCGEKGVNVVNPEYGRGEEIAEIIEELLKIVADLARLDFKTPPHDLAAWVVRELEKRR